MHVTHPRNLILFVPEAPTGSRDIYWVSYYTNAIKPSSSTLLEGLLYPWNAIKSLYALNAIYLLRGFTFLKGKLVVNIYILGYAYVVVLANCAWSCPASTSSLMLDVMYVNSYLLVERHPCSSFMTNAAQDLGTADLDKDNKLRLHRDQISHGLERVFLYSQDALSRLLIRTIYT